MDRFKMQAASEVGVNLQSGYNGHLTSREAGSVGGQMVKNMYPVRIAKFDRNSRTSFGHVQKVEYIAALTVQKIPTVFRWILWGSFTYLHE